MKSIREFLYNNMNEGVSKEAKELLNKSNNLNEKGDDLQKFDEINRDDMKEYIKGYDKVRTMLVDASREMANIRFHSFKSGFKDLADKSKTFEDNINALIADILKYRRSL